LFQIFLSTRNDLERIRRHEISPTFLVYYLRHLEIYHICIVHTLCEIWAKETCLVLFRPFVSGPMKRPAPHLRTSDESLLQGKQHHVAADGLPNRGSVTQNLSHQPAVVPFW